jgi:hypothetical protein
MLTADAPALYVAAAFAIDMTVGVGVGDGFADAVFAAVVVSV